MHDTGQSHRWAIIMEKFNLLIFKYIKSISKWGFLTFLHNHKSLWAAGIYPSRIKARKRTLVPLCAVWMSTWLLCDARVHVVKEYNVSSALYWVLRQQAHFVFCLFSCVAVKVVTLSVGLCASAAPEADFGRIHPMF